MALERAATQYRGFQAAYQNPREIPRSFVDGAAHTVPPSDWTSGFVAGNFWLLFEYTREREFQRLAERWTAALEEQKSEAGTHDVGFMLNCSFGNGLRLTGNENYAEVLGAGARSLATRYSAAVGAIRSWNFGTWSFPVIIDNMMNLELLFVAKKLAAPGACVEIATTHASTTLRDHYRADYSAYHLVDYRPESGAIISKETRQGLKDESVWARGQGWGLYGFTVAYRETREARFLEHALRVADFLVDHPGIPADGVPYFDFDAPTTEGVPPLRDAAAAAITASALFELSTFAAPSAAERYSARAFHVLEALSSPAYSAATGENGHFLLLHSVGDYPRGTEVDAALNYADYYYLEALLRGRALAVHAEQ